MISLFAALVLTFAAADVHDSPTTESSPAIVDIDLGMLDALIDDETKVMDALRQFDRSQQDLADWDRELAEQHAGKGDMEQAQAKLRQAKQRVAAVRTAYEKVLEHYPSNARALNYYGELLYDRFGDQAGGLKNWHTAAALDNKLGPPRNNLALHYFHGGSYAMGFKYLDEALDLEPDNPDFLYNATQIYLVHFPQAQDHYKWNKKQVFEQAMKNSRRVTELLPQEYHVQQDYAVNFYRAEDFGVEADWRAAAVAWQRARALAEKKDQVYYTWLNEARAWMALPDDAEAQRCLHEALTMKPGDRVPTVLLDRIKQRAPADESASESE